MSDQQTDRWTEGWLAGIQRGSRERRTGEADRAFWQAGPCRAWCTTIHQDGDRPEDRYHYSNNLSVTLRTEDMRESDPTEIRIHLMQHERERDARLHLGEGEMRGFHLTLNEAESLMENIAQVIKMAANDTSDNQLHAA
ncbi:hypothetical protein Athai_38740 [Actinocatenispora thailandica]|uniref:Uncharacterized protein n=1 Tax=Actinocatenispora thailandica TaxID=227318 RepID=A0A7R7DRG5_9ACTN|nr:hypothetical protein [Actinocatenispora thailandica]BCJ36371.1 hypothetical protein Athai_38740 [Actinocatenispora thailandica]